MKTIKEHPTEKEILDVINTKTTFQKTFLELTSDFESKFSITADALKFSH